MTFQIELVGGPLDGTHYVLEDVNDYPREVLLDMEPEPTEATKHGPDDVVEFKRLLYRKRPRVPGKLAVYYDFDGIH